MNVIEVKNFSFGIGEKDILRDISFIVGQGEYTSIIGPNGAGKSTLLKCLIRIFIGGRGSVLIKGSNLKSYGQKELARLISYVPQAGEEIPPFTVKEFVLMGRYPYLSPFSPASKEDEMAAQEALETTAMEGFAERPMSTLSGGERQKVFIAATLAQGAEIILLDEPTTFLDPRHQRDILSMLRKINRERGAAILSVTHDINHAALYGRRVIALKHGRIVFDGSPENLMNNQRLNEIYERTFTFIEHPESRIPVIIPEAE